MAKYPGTGNERRVEPGALTGVVSAVFDRCGMSASDARLLAETLVQADLRGIHSHGVLRVPEYVRHLTAGGVNPRGRPRVVKDSGAALLVDGDNSMGQIGATFAMREAISRARTTGVAAAALRGSNHCGAMDYYAMLALPEDMIGLATTNAMPTMAPFGGTDKIVGLHPLGVAVPAATEEPFVLDISFGASAIGKIRVYQQKGYPLPDGWATDAEGRSTTDPAAAIAGLIQPIGAYKGTGLAIFMGIVSAVLSGASYGPELGNLVDGAKPGEDGQFLLALRIAAFEDPARFKSRMDGILRQIKRSRRAPGVERVYAPGEMEAELAREQSAKGIPLNDATLRGVIDAALRLGVDPAAIR